MVRFLGSVQAKVTAALVGVLVMAVLLCHVLLRDAALKVQFEQLRDQLKVVACIAALSVDPALLREIPLRREGVSTPAYQLISRKLQSIRQDNPKIAYVYVLTKTEREGIWQFVVDADPLQRRREGITSYPGDKYQASRFSAMIKGWDAASVDPVPVRDEWGVTLSGYAPVRDENGTTIAVLGVDMLAAEIDLMRRELDVRGWRVLLVGIFLALLVGILLSRRMVRPLEDLVEGVRRISRGELDHCVKVRGHDEISQLSVEFNKMAVDLRGARKKNAEYFYGVIQSMVRIVEAKDTYTHGHSERVAGYAVKVAARLGFSPDEIEMLRQVAVLHDIGKLGIQDAVLNKPGKLSAEEWEQMRLHPVTGEEILKPVLFDLQMLAVIRGHHERYDGRGYPDGLSGSQIHVMAQVLAVADAYDAMISSRAYRPVGLSVNDAVAELQKNKGSQFDARIVDAFCAILQQDGKEGAL